MAKYDKPISEFNECPHCDGDYGYYQLMYISGWASDTKTFSGEPNNKGELHDGLHSSSESKFYACSQCNKRIARVDLNPI